LGHSYNFWITCNVEEEVISMHGVSEKVSKAKAGYIKKFLKYIYTIASPPPPFTPFQKPGGTGLDVYN
jgi:hypothetical protein